MINFPDAPTANQVFSAAGKNWSWDGGKWVVAFPGATGDDIFPINGSTTLPSGFMGVVYVENTTGAPITVTLPPLPFAGQTVLVKDVLGNATAYPITVTGSADLIEGQTTIVVMYNYGWVDLFFTGAQWVQK